MLIWVENSFSHTNGHPSSSLSFDLIQFLSECPLHRLITASRTSFFLSFPLLLDNPAVSKAAKLSPGEPIITR